MRLTIKGTGLIDCGGTIADLGKEEYSRRYHERSVLAHDKLSKLEDLEDKVGVDLSVWISLMLDGCYVRDKWANKPGEISHFALTRFPTRDGFWARYGGAHKEHYFRFCQRGETWGLRKEELE